MTRGYHGVVFNQGKVMGRRVRLLCCRVVLAPICAGQAIAAEPADIWRLRRA